MSLKRGLDEDAFQPIEKKHVSQLRNISIKRRFSEEAIQQSERSEKKFKTSIPNCTAGVIQRIKLENFMCHAKLTLCPNTNINFITGSNGAGKSSIIQALVLGLCGDSKHTKRYSKISNFIKKGSTKAVIEIMLNNVGEDSFKPEVYGKSLIFERTIRDSGQSSFVLKDANGNIKEKQTKKAREEGKRALDSFKIQVDNPVIILQQDEAKEMLKVESPDKLYQFFSQATMIKQVTEQYKASFDDLEVLTKNVKNLEIVVRQKRKALIEIKVIIDRTEERDEEWVKIKGEFAWADVKECGDRVLDIQAHIEDIQSKLKPPTEKLLSLHNEEQNLKDLKIEKEIKIEDERNMFSGQEEELATLNQYLNSLKQAEKASTVELKNCDKATFKIKTEIQNLEEQTQYLLGQTAKEREQSEKDKIKQASVLKKMIDECSKAIEKESDMRLELDSKERNLDQIGENINTKKKELQITIDSVRKEIMEMERLGNGTLAVYGKPYAMVDAGIQKHKFEKKPFGPVGRYIQLKAPAVPNSSLSNLVETILSPVLRNYLCHSDQDRRTLTKIFDKVFGPGFKPKIVVSRFLPNQHKVDRAKVPLLLMDLLDIREVPVFNFLVDQVRIESVAICSEQDEAKDMTTRRDNVPKNLSYAITADFYQFHPPTACSSYRSYFIEQRAQGLLSGSSSEKLRIKRMLLEENEAKFKDIDREKSRIQGSRAEVGINKHNIFKKIQELKRNLSDDKSKFQDLMFKPENDTSQNLMEKLTLKNQDKKKREVKRVEIAAQRSATEVELKNVKITRDSKAKELAALKGKWCTVDREYANTNVLFANKRKEVANQEKVVGRMKDDLQNWERKRGDAVQEHQKARARALNITNGNVIIPSESKLQLNAKLKFLKERKNERSDGDTDLTEEYNRLSKEYRSSAIKLDDNKMFLEQFDDMNSSRRDMVLLIRKRVINMVTRKFNHITQEIAKEIGCNIFLRINVQKKELHFFKSASGTLTKTNLSSLSGGEKSFAQMALICSLWEHTQSPFRCLDEWDVFLDQVNREKIQNKLYKFGLKQYDKQFVFLSPQGGNHGQISQEDQDKVAIIEIKKS